MPFVTSHGRPIYYELHGEAHRTVGVAPVLFLHGAGSNAATWWQQLPAFTARHTCLTMDIRCFGRSAAPTGEFSMALFVDDVLAVLDAEQVPQVVIVGQSLGGMIGLQIALRYPARIAAFVACDTTLAIDHPVLLGILERRVTTMAAVRIEERSLGAWFLRERPDLAALYAQINHFNPSAHSIPAAEWRAAMASLNRPEQVTPLSALRAVACPTLFVVGSEDPLVPVAVMHEVSALVQGSEVVVIDAAGHSAYFEKPAEFNRRALAFIDGLASSRAPGNAP